MKSRNNSSLPDQSPESISELTEEMDQIKRLLILFLLKSGSSGREIAKALGVHESTISRQYNMGKVRPLTVSSESEKEED